MHTAEQNTVTELWDKRYEVKIPYLLSMSDEDRSIYGVRLSGIREIDNARNSDLIVTMKTPAELADYHKRHVPVWMLKRADIPAIYQSITSHLERWKQHLTHGINNRHAPFDDLIDFDEYAESIYEKAWYIANGKPISLSPMDMAINRVSTHSQIFDAQAMNRLFGRAPGATVINPVENAPATETKVPSREGYAAFFIEKKAVLRPAGAFNFR